MQDESTKGIIQRSWYCFRKPPRNYQVEALALARKSGKSLGEYSVRIGSERTRKSVRKPQEICLQTKDLDQCDQRPKNTGQKG